ncbi:MAG: Hpt domain-containing protein [Desulfobacterota bacterium]|nr:Hpt domain-containing protein [Thermodesulfobacteriota bacterium]
MSLSAIAEELGLDEPECEEILNLFIDTTVSDLDALGQAIQDGDALLAVQSAHSIKGASANLGLQEISSAARDIEMKARQGIMAGAGDAAEVIRHHLDSLKGEVSELSRTHHA